MNQDHLKDTMNEYLPLRDVVFNTLRQAIITGEFAPGERLMEIALANRLGVSRTPVREAIRKLELEGLVIMIPRKGAQVARITEKNLRDVIEIRSVLEELAVSLSCERIDEEGKKRLEEAHREFVEAVNTNDILTMVEKDEQFHNAIFESTCNDRLIPIINNLREQFYRYRMEYIKDIQHHTILVKEHEKLVHAIFNRDSETARRIMRTHLQNQQEAVIKATREQ